MDITEKIEEIQANGAWHIDRTIRESLIDIFGRNEGMAVFTAPDGPNSPPIYINNRFTDADRILRPSIADIDLFDNGDMDGDMTLRTTHSGMLTFDSIPQFSSEGGYITASTIAPMTMTAYAQITQDDYNSLLERISSLEERIRELERGI